VREDAVQLIERVITDDDFALPRAAVLDLHRRAEFFRELVLQPLYVGIEALGAVLADRRAATAFVQHAAHQRLGFAHRQALPRHQPADFHLLAPLREA